MNKRNLVLIFSAIIALTIFALAVQPKPAPRYVEFIPMRANLSFNMREDAVVVDEDTVMNSDFIERLTVVLDFHKIEYAYRDDSIYVDEELLKDRVLVVNLTQQAKSDAWIKQTKRILDRKKQYNNKAN